MTISNVIQGRCRQVDNHFNLWTELLPESRERMTFHNSMVNIKTAREMFARIICLMLIACMLVFVVEQLITDAFADNIIPALIPIEDHRDFIRFAADPQRPDATNNRVTGFTKLLYVDAVAARGNDIFVADTSQRTIFHIDRARRTLSVFAALTGGVTTDIYVASDFSVYVIDRIHGQVIQYSRDGRIIRIFENNRALISPIAVVESEDMHRRVLVADGVAGHIAVFNRLGNLSRIIGQNINSPHPVSNIIDMVSGDGIIYLLDQTAREVSIIDFEGRHHYSMGNLQLKQPVAMAVDYCQRIFVADQFDNSIHVFYDEDPLIIFENDNGGINGFKLITDLWIDNELLYVADGATGNIKVLRIEGGCS